MKKTLLFSAIAIMLIACSKKNDPIPVKSIQTNTQIKPSQDSDLLGVWASDSSKMDEGITTYSVADLTDTLFITNSLFIHNNYFYNIKKTLVKDTWVTENDSLFLSNNGYKGNHFQYIIKGDVLLLHLKCQVCASRGIKYWYHKVI